MLSCLYLLDLYDAILFIFLRPLLRSPVYVSYTFTMLSCLYLLDLYDAILFISLRPLRRYLVYFS